MAHWTPGQATVPAPRYDKYRLRMTFASPLVHFVLNIIPQRPGPLPEPSRDGRPPRPAVSLAVGGLLFLLLVATATTVATAKELFPRYPSIGSNVAFWEKIYGHYSEHEAVLHDRQDLTRIYQVLPLLDPRQPDADRRNRASREAAIERYRQLLLKLSREQPRTAEEKRVAALFPGKNSRREMAAAADNIRIQTGLRERFRQGVRLSGAYLTEIKRIFKSYQLPEELAYLPHVESSFNLKAHSKFGAAGIWQFTRTTGKNYLTIDDAVDERLDPILASHAAARYLQNSYRALNNWPLAITSYNYGLAGTLRATREEGSYERIFRNYQKGYFKFAARNFYPEFLAALNVAKKLEKDPSIVLLRPMAQRNVTLPGYAEIEILSRHFGVSTATIQEHNPALRTAVFTGEKRVPKGYTLRLPANEVKAALVASLPPALFQPEQRASLFHRVAVGDTASGIAKRYGISLNSLMRANNLDNYATIYLRQNLRIPKAALASQGPEIFSLTPDRQKSKAAPPVLAGIKKQRPSETVDLTLPTKDPTVYTVSGLYRQNGRQYGYITVQPEENLALYATWLGSSVGEIQTLNGLAPKQEVFPGHRLLLMFAQLTPALFENRRLDYLRETEDDFFSAFSVVGRKLYRVSPGDTIWDLCHNKFEIPLWLLERYNSSINLGRLYAEQELIIPIIQPI
jgi:membrane-bound lytic murein transglycosylase D